MRLPEARIRLLEAGLDVSLRTLSEWCQRGLVQAVKANGRWEVSKEALQEAVQSGRVPPRYHAGQLTPAEVAALHEGARQGLSRRELARRFGVSMRTVSRHWKALKYR